MITVLRGKAGDEFIRRQLESQRALEMLTRVNEALGISESPAVAPEVSEQPEISEAAALPARHVVHKGAEK